MCAAGAGISTQSSAREPVHVAPSARPCTRASPACAARPSGAPLEPDVNSTAASCSRSVHSVGDRRRRRAARRGRRRRTSGATAASALARRRPAPSWWWTGAATAPSRQHARYSTATSSRFGDCHATASPGSTPRARSPPATRATPIGERGATRARSSSASSDGPVPRAARLRGSRSATGRMERRVRARAVGRQARRDFQPSLAGVAPFSTLVPMKLRWISTVPAPMHSPRMSRYTRSTGYSRREAVAAEQLDRLVAHELRGEVRRGLRHRGLERGRRAVRAGHVHRALQQQARAFELRRHVGDLPLQTLEVGERACRRRLRSFM